MENLSWKNLKEYAGLNPQKQIIIVMSLALLALYWWGKSNDDKAWEQQKEIKSLNTQIFQLQRDGAMREIACEQRVLNATVQGKIDCEQEKREIHKSYAESARQFKKSFDKNR